MCLESVSQFVPSFLSQFNHLESHDLTIPEISRLAESALQGKITNWKLVAKIASELIRNDMVGQASLVAGVASRIMSSRTAFTEGVSA